MLTADHCEQRRGLVLADAAATSKDQGERWCVRIDAWVWVADHWEGVSRYWCCLHDEFCQPHGTHFKTRAAAEVVAMVCSPLGAHVVLVECLPEARPE